MTASSKNKWYSDGLKFECTQCGACCAGEPGYVWVNKDEIAAIADHLKLTDDEFRDRYVRKIGVRFSLVEFPNGDCVFLDSETRGCTIYTARPIQCRTWPFWTSNLKSEATWKETCEACPGAGKGTLYQLPEIEERRKQKRV